MDIVNPFQVGDWLQWTADHSVKRGQVVQSKGPSIVVRWLGGEEQVFPVVEGYVDPSSPSSSRMVVIERPKEASRIAKETERDHMSVTRAAAILGTTPKRVRAMLRSGQLHGFKEGDKWKTVLGVSVNAESASKLKT